MSDCVLGVIGGMGPYATAKFIENITKHTKASKDQEHLNMVVLNHCSMPDRTETIMSGEKEELLTHFKEALKILEFANVDAISIPCNTSHYFINDIQEMTNIPIINMIDETCKYITENYSGKEIVVLATQGTIKSRIYEKYAKKWGIKIKSLTENQEKIVMDTIYDMKNKKIIESPTFNQLVYGFMKEDLLVVFACTELSSLELPDAMEGHIVDAMTVLMKESVERCGKEWI